MQSNSTEQGSDMSGVYRRYPIKCLRNSREGFMLIVRLDAGGTLMTPRSVSSAQYRVYFGVTHGRNRAFGRPALVEPLARTETEDRHIKAVIIPDVDTLPTLGRAS